MWPWLKRATASQVHAGSTTSVQNVAALSMGACAWRALYQAGRLLIGR